MEFSAINFQDKFSKFSELWLPKIIAQLNDYQFKPAKVKSEFVRHLRPETDEAFIVVNGAREILLIPAMQSTN